MGTRTDAALEALVAARADFETEVDRLEAAGRAAVDVPAKVRANPAKAAGVAAGGAFLAVGGPKRVFRRARRAITGKEEELPSELLPKDIEKALKSMGTRRPQGPRHARARLREVPRGPEEGAGEGGRGRRRHAVSSSRPSGRSPPKGGKQLAERMLDPNQPAFNEQLEKIRQRRRDAATSGEAAAAQRVGCRQEAHARSLTARRT